MNPIGYCPHLCPDKCTNPFCDTHHNPHIGERYEPRPKKAVRYECGPVKGVAIIDASDRGVHEVISMTKAEMIELATHLLDSAAKM